ncbi:glycoside hydrolase family 88 protein [Pseudosporangium ferrugineum]|uniref:Unsaturated rhamnogalacturonyl hydrolase n=1 Tax=Pseudosporangium ferrugineum TaxID=439699 RepID=A0A2T0RQG3_9ACTN|nr:glycoside hydrolase family 88 protein [Pseudosporangium ferrugineum]PRY23434.1 unsaturated rhamnogalacturonyl hydrolase [Pseudosporangium ferrugineum]
MIDRVLTALLAMQRQSWEQGVAAQAALDLGRDDLAVLLAGAAVTRQAADGRLGDVDGEAGAVNGAACGEAVLAAYGRTGDPVFADAARRQLAWLVSGAPRAADGTLFHLLGGREVWADTVYMTVPFLALSGRADLAWQQVEGHRSRLCRDGLYSAIWSEETGAPRRAARWGGGNGWVVAAVARTLRLVPDLPGRDRLAAHGREVLDACLALRRPDGLFHDVLDDPATFRETNAAQMFAYAALTGAADGWLPPDYAGTGRDLLAAAAREVDAHGVVRGAAGSPHFDRPGASAEAQAFHLLATAAAGQGTGSSTMTGISRSV